MSRAPPPVTEALVADVRVSHNAWKAVRRALIQRAQERPLHLLYCPALLKSHYNWYNWVELALPLTQLS
jgi:hypothetical protein